jgi:hypothetical protein
LPFIIFYVNIIISQSNSSEILNNRVQDREVGVRLGGVMRRKFVVGICCVAVLCAASLAIFGHTGHTPAVKKVPRHLAENSYNAHMSYSRNVVDPPKIEIRAFDGYVWPPSKEVGRFVRTRQGVTFKLGAGDESFEAFASYGNTSTPAFHNYRWTNSSDTVVMPYSRYLPAPNGKKYKTMLEGIEVYVYNPKFPEYHRFPLSQIEEGLSPDEELIENN